MATFDDLRVAVREYAEHHRHPERPSLEVAPIYDLFPAEAQSDHAWPDQWPHASRKGVYIIMDEQLNVLYVGKASFENTIGARLGSYFAFATDRACKIVDENWSAPPRYVSSVAVPDDSAFEAPALEEYLIRKLVPRDNTVGRR